MNGIIAVYQSNHTAGQAVSQRWEERGSGR